MRTAKDQINQHIRAVLSGPSLSADIINGQYRMYSVKRKCSDETAHAWVEFECVHFAHTRRHIFDCRGPVTR